MSRSGVSLAAVASAASPAAMASAAPPEPRPVSARLALLCALAIVAGLPIDQHLQHGQAFVDVFVWAVFFAVLLHADRAGRVSLLACLLFATLGECFLALVWGLYDYRLGNLPLFVPPGHALLLCLGLYLCRHVGERAVVVVPWLAVPAVLTAAIVGGDTFGLVLFAVFALAMVRGRARSLYAVMFVLALALELYGTWLGNWRWRPNVPWLGLATCNPPLAAGAFYCGLDVLVVATARRFARA